MREINRAADLAFVSDVLQAFPHRRREGAVRAARGLLRHRDGEVMAALSVTDLGSLFLVVAAQDLAEVVRVGDHLPV